MEIGVAFGMDGRDTLAIDRVGFYLLYDAYDDADNDNDN